MLKYNLCLIKQDNRILLLNREKSQWMGRWNGVGGKLKAGEEPRAAMLREIREETGLSGLALEFRGFLTWSLVDGSGFGGLYFYFGFLPDQVQLATPQSTAEGILDWKEINWILHPENLGVASNLPHALDYALNHTGCFDQHSVYRGYEMVDLYVNPISAVLEHDAVQRSAYLKQYEKRLRKPS